MSSVTFDRGKKLAIASKKERREQRQKEVIGQLSREAENVVVKHFAPGTAR